MWCKTYVYNDNFINKLLTSDIKFQIFFNHERRTISGRITINFKQNVIIRYVTTRWICKFLYYFFFLTSSIFNHKIILRCFFLQQFIFLNYFIAKHYTHTCTGHIFADESTWYNCVIMVPYSSPTKFNIVETRAFTGLYKSHIDTIKTVYIWKSIFPIIFDRHYRILPCRKLVILL